MTIFLILNDEQMSNKVGVEHQPVLLRIVFVSGYFVCPTLLFLAT